MGIVIGIIIAVVAIFFISRAYGKKDMHDTGEILIQGQRINIKQRAFEITESILGMIPDFEEYIEEYSEGRIGVFSKVQEHFERLIYKKCRIWITPDEGKYALALAFYYAEGYDDSNPLKESIIQRMMHDAGV